VNLCVLSGKGGTGKTTVAVNLAVLMQAGYIDCDVEEPNGFIFLKPEHASTKETLVDYPVIDSDKCVICGACARACQFNAMASTRKNVMLFPTLCHGCHACELVCEHKAIGWTRRPVGVVERGVGYGIRCAQGVLNVGEHMAVPVIRQLLSGLDESENNILDCAPGASCNVVTTLQAADAALIVTEPTTFGLHDMAIAVELLTQMEIPFAVVVNKSQGGDTMIRQYCADQGIALLGGIPYAREAAEAYSKGLLLSDLPGYRQTFVQLFGRLKEVFTWN
jgi:MinD superfamily P-loop ATPase